MRKAELRMNEIEKYEVIKHLVDHDGNKNRAAAKLGVTRRTIDRMIHTYKEQGKEGFLHGNRGRSPAIAKDESVRAQVIELYQSKYENANLTHFCELLESMEQIKVSRNTVNHWLRTEHILSPKAHRKTKRKLKKELSQLQQAAKSGKSKCEIEKQLECIEQSEAHPTRPRKAYMGEQIQMDASSICWFANITTHLHLAIDDASGMVVGAYLDYEETLKGYYHVLYQILINYGIPALFKVDKRTVFEYKRKNAPQDYEDTFTQFGYACKTLGIEIEASSVPQTKGRVERLNQTFQSRLPIELRLAGVTTIEEANQFLIEYIKRFNQQFALRLNSTHSVFERQPSEDVINTTLAVLTSRVIDNGHSIRFKNGRYQPVTKDGSAVYLTPGSTALVIEAFDQNLYLNVLDQLFALKLIPEHEIVSHEFDTVKETKPRKYYIPPLTHPWKQASYNAYLARQKHRPEYINEYSDTGANV